MMHLLNRLQTYSKRNQKLTKDKASCYEVSDWFFGWRTWGGELASPSSPPKVRLKGEK